MYKKTSIDMPWKLARNTQVWDMMYTLSGKGTKGGVKMDVNWDKPTGNKNQNWDSIKSFIKISMGLWEHPNILRKHIFRLIQEFKYSQFWSKIIKFLKPKMTIFSFFNQKLVGNISQYMQAYLQMNSSIAAQAICIGIENKQKLLSFDPPRSDYVVYGWSLFSVGGFSSW